MLLTLTFSPSRGIILYFTSPSHLYNLNDFLFHELIQIKKPGPIIEISGRLKFQACCYSPTPFIFDGTSTETALKIALLPLPPRRRMGNAVQTSSRRKREGHKEEVEGGRRSYDRSRGSFTIAERIICRIRRKPRGGPPPRQEEGGNTVSSPCLSRLRDSITVTEGERNWS